MAVFDEILIEILVIGFGAEFDDRMVWLKSLDDDMRVLVTAIGAADDLGE